jgi:glucose uptake protein GlcU
LDELTGIYWVIAAAVLFGSQFIPSKYCPKFRSSSYNVSMAWGIVACSIVSFLVLGMVSINIALVPYAMLGGFLWVTGNYLLIIGVAKAGMARAFCMINFAAVISFFGGGLVLGELTGVTTTRIALMLVAVALVIAGSLLVTTTTPSGKEKRSDRADIMKGLLASFMATVFFSMFNIIMGYVINTGHTTPGAAFIAFSPGIMFGALLPAVIPDRKGLSDWVRAPAKWHYLAIAQGFIWSGAMVCIMFGWEGTGIAVGTPVQVGTQTLVSAVWGILMFKEFKDLKDKGKAYLKFGLGAALTIVGIAMMALV